MADCITISSKRSIDLIADFSKYEAINPKQGKTISTGFSLSLIEPLETRCDKNAQPSERFRLHCVTPRQVACSSRGMQSGETQSK